jgi:hypothetical protein
METHGPLPEWRDVRRKVRSEPHGIAEFSGDQPRPKLAAALAAPNDASSGANPDILGEPMGIREVAQLIGCSAWTVRQKYVPLGLPHMRSGPNGKLIFYRNQITHWLLTRQEKGGTIR